MAQKIMATLVHFERTGDRYAVIRLKPQTNNWKHKPGQYTEITFGEGPDALTKTYSIGSAMRADDSLDFCMQWNDPQLSELAKSWQTGQTEFGLSPAAGHFHIPSYKRSVVLLAGGSGITPLKAILEDRMYHAGKGQDSARSVLLYGCSDDQDIPFHDALKALADRHADRITLRFFAERLLAKDGGRAEVGRPLSALATYLTADAEYLMCGPPPFLDAARAVLLQAQIPAEQIHQDRY